MIPPKCVGHMMFRGGMSTCEGTKSKTMLCTVGQRLAVGVWEVSAAIFVLSQSTMCPGQVLPVVGHLQARGLDENSSPPKSFLVMRVAISPPPGLLPCVYKSPPRSGFPVPYLAKRSTSESFSTFRVLWARAMTRKPCTV